MGVDTSLKTSGCSLDAAETLAEGDVHLMDTHFLFKPGVDQTSRGSDRNQDGRVSVAEGAAPASLRVSCLVSGGRVWELLSSPTGDLRTGGGQTGAGLSRSPPPPRSAAGWSVRLSTLQHRLLL